MNPLALIISAFTGFAFATAIWRVRRSPGAVSSAQAQLMIDAAAEKSFHDGMLYAAIRQGERTAAAAVEGVRGLAYDEGFDAGVFAASGPREGEYA